VAKGDDADAFRLRHAAEVGDRNAWHPVDCLHTIELQRVDDEVKAVGQLLLRLRRFRFPCYGRFCH
jgi:hypothetical protein